MLIECPECKQQISDKAQACPHCGIPLKPSAQEIPPAKPQRRTGGKGCLIALAVIVGLVVIGSLLPSQQQSPTNSTADVIAATPSGVQIEENGQFITNGGKVDHSAAALNNVDILVRMVRANGYRCDSVTAYSPYVFSRGFELKCNDFNYKYNFEDKGQGYQFVPPK